MPSARFIVMLLALVLAPVAGISADPKKPVARPQQPTTSAPMARPTPAPQAAPRAIPRPSASPAPFAPRAPQAAPRAPEAAPRAPEAAPRAPTPVVPRAPVAPSRPEIGTEAPRTPVEAPTARPVRPVEPGLSPEVRRVEPKIVPLSWDREPGVGDERRGPGVDTGRVRVPADFDLDRPQGTVRKFDGGERLAPARPEDPRHTRPHQDYVSPPPGGPHAPPSYYWYRPWYTHWYCHPYWRYTHSTWAVVGFGFDVYPYDPWWTPPYRSGWMWVPGYWDWGWYVPGYWSPIAPAPVHYVYVPGWWSDDVYVEGYYRRDGREDWEWVDGYYLDDGTFVQGHWRPDHEGPDGYTWEPGFWDGETWIDGFWRPEFREGFTWVSPYYDAEGVYNAGYWLPIEEKPGQAWIPGWFDGKKWIDGYWVPESKLSDEEVDAWQPPEGHDAGTHEDDVPTTTPPAEPLAIPVEE